MIHTLRPDIDSKRIRGGSVSPAAPEAGEAPPPAAGAAGANRR